MPIYMKYGSVNGSVTASGFEKWIELASFSWGVGRNLSTPTGASADREASAPSVSDIAITKQTDISSFKLLEEALWGQGQTVKISFTTTVQNKTDEYLGFELTNTMISAYAPSSGGDRPTESLSLNFTKFQVKFKENDLSGAKLGGPATVGYDISTASKS
jgi:type VI secretion system secreted protein Hcp